METTSLISQGMTLMVFGMGFVFVFLTLLVGATTGMSALVNRYLPEPVATPVAPRQKAAAAAPADDAQLLAVISAAVHQYRQRHRK